MITDAIEPMDNTIAFSPSDNCKILGLARNTISKYNTIRLKVMKIGKHYRIHRAALEEFIVEAEDDGRTI